MTTRIQSSFAIAEKRFGEPLSALTQPGKEGVSAEGCGSITIQAFRVFTISRPYIRSAIFSSLSSSLLFLRYSE